MLLCYNSGSFDRLLLPLKHMEIRQGEAGFSKHLLQGEMPES